MNEHFNSTYAIPSFVVGTDGNSGEPTSFFLTLADLGNIGGLNLNMATRCEDYRIYAVTSNGEFYFWDYKGYRWKKDLVNNWVLKMIAYGNDGALWLVNNAGNVVKYNGTAWVEEPVFTDNFGPLKMIAFDKNANLWCVNDQGEIYEWNLGALGWVARSNPTGSAVKMLAFDVDNNLWVINEAHEVLTNQNDDWQNLGKYGGWDLKWIDFTFDPRVLPS